jgi:hypothetical protein
MTSGGAASLYRTKRPVIFITRAVLEVRGMYQSAWSSKGLMTTDDMGDVRGEDSAASLLTAPACGPSSRPPLAQGTPTRGTRRHCPGRSSRRVSAWIPIRACINDTHACTDTDISLVVQHVQPSPLEPLPHLCRNTGMRVTSAACRVPMRPTCAKSLPSTPTSLKPGADEFAKGPSQARAPPVTAAASAACPCGDDTGDDAGRRTMTTTTRGL